MHQRDTDEPDRPFLVTAVQKHTAVQEHEGETFVFVHEKGEEFERRDVELGQTGNRLAEVLQGIEAGESVVVEGGLALKAKLLAGSVEAVEV